MEIEGFLTKWTNYISGWKERYFALSNGILYYSTKKNSALKGQIHLSVSKISQNEQDPLGLIIDSGTKLLHLRAETITEKMKWLNALKSSKIEIQELDQSLTKMRNHNINSIQLDEFIQRKESKHKNDFEEKEGFTQKVDNFLKEIVQAESNLDKSIVNLAKRLDLAKDSEVLTLLGSVIEISESLIKSVTGCYNVFMREKKNMIKIIKRLEKNEKKDLTIEEIGFVGTSQESLEFGNSENLSKTIEDLSINEEVATSYPSLIQKSMEISLKFNEEYKRFLAEIQETHPIKYKILTENAVFKSKALPLPYHPSVITPPKKSEEPKNLIPLVKAFFGKKFEELPIPISMHEPLSLLQRSCEIFKNSYLLEKANESNDSLVRLAHIMAFAFSFYTTTSERVRMPFIAKLGETFEYTNLKSGINLHAEQVTNSRFAINCQGRTFSFWNETEIKMLFWGKNMEFHPEGLSHITLLIDGDHYVFTRPTTSVEDILTTYPYIDNFGEMLFKNLKTKETGTIYLKKRSFNDQGAVEAEGWIYDKDGKSIYIVKGKWNAYFSISKVEKDEEIIICLEEEQGQNNNPYSFSDFTKELNILDRENVLSLPLTDSRFRADIRALEYGMMDQAKEENQNILDEIKKLRKSNEGYEPKFFKKKIINEDEFTYIYKN